MSPLRLVRFFLPAAAIVVTFAAGACPDDQYESCVFGACVCLPKVGGTIGQEAERIKKETRAQSTGPALELWLNQSRNTSRPSSQPIPDRIRQALRGFIDDDAMNRARYKVGDNGVLNLAGLTLAYGDNVTGSTAQAVTLIDTIVFRSADDALGNAALWAHELTHVRQFRDWGTHDFAIRYARDSNSVESEAYAVQNEFPRWRAAQIGNPGLPPINSGLPPMNPGVPGGGLPSGTVMQGCGCWGPTTGFAPEPRCRTGQVSAFSCPGMCPGGMPYQWQCRQ